MEDNEKMEIPLDNKPDCPPRDDEKIHVRIYNYIKKFMNIDNNEIIESDETV